MQEGFKMKRHQVNIISAFTGDMSAETSHRNLLDEASMAVMLGILFPLPFLLILPLVSLHIILPVFLPLLGLIHHLLPLSLQVF